MMMNHRYVLFTGLMVTALCIHAQDIELQTKEKYEYADATQLWRRTLNPAGLSLDTLTNRGISYFEFSHQQGTHYRVQDGDEQNKLLFTSERYQKIGKYLYGYGRFTFDMGRQFNRSWSDVLRSHHSNPYFSGSSIKGKYDFQNFDLSAALATLPIKNFTFGARLDYKVGDLSRLKDPRSRTNLADYQLTPAVTYTWNKHSLGLSGYYHRRKEKIPNITTVQTDPNLKYYTFTGMENADGTTGGYSGFEREFVNHEFGGELSYQYKNERIQTLTTLSYAKGNEDVWGDIKYSPGKYHTTTYNLLSMNRIKSGRTEHIIDISINYQTGKADEYRQEKIIEKDPVTGIESSYWNTLLTYDERYTVDLLNANLHYRLLWSNHHTGEATAYAGARAYFQSVEDQYNLPSSSLTVRQATICMEGGYSFLRKNNRSLWIEAEAGYHISLSSDLSLNDPSTEYAQSVLLPDMTYYGASYAHGKLQIQYQMPVTIKKHTNVWFVKATGAYLKTDKKTDSKMFGISLGLYH